MTEMTSLFQKAYPDTDEGMATESLARVATAVGQHLGSSMDDETRIGCIIDMHRLERDDLPEEQRPLCDELRAFPGIG